MKIVYAANIRMPTEKAHGAQIVKTCEAFAQNRDEVELVVANRSTPVTEDTFEYYRVAKIFSVHRIWSANTVGWGRFGFWVTAITFAISLFRHLGRQTHDVLYGRDEEVLWLACLLGHRSVVWESHVGSWNMFARGIVHRAKAIVVISEGLKDFYMERGVDASKIHVARDGVDLSDFAAPQTQTEARERLGLPKDKKVAMYIGRLDGWKGADTFCAASEYLPDNVMMVVIGGEPKQVEEFAKKYPEVKFLGALPYRELADNQAAADVLVLPNTGKDKISARFTSPLKLFSYMASEKPIVASDLPSIREILSEKNAILVKPDDAQAIADGITWSLEHDEARVRAGQARKDVELYSWNARAKSILQFIRMRTG